MTHFERVWRDWSEPRGQQQDRLCSPQPVVHEGRLDELSLVLSEKGDGMGPGCSFKACINAAGARLSSVASVERIWANGL